MHTSTLAQINKNIFETSFPMMGDVGPFFDLFIESMGGIGRTRWDEISYAKPCDLESGAMKMLGKVNAWIFSADSRHFEQFATARDRAIVASLTERERDAWMSRI